jgi:hypothetical protein
MSAAAMFGTWRRAQFHAELRAQSTGLKYRVKRGPDWGGHPRWMAEPLAERTPEVARLVDAALRAGSAQVAS